MAGSRPFHGSATKARCAELIQMGTSVENICNRLGVSKSYVKRVRAEIKAKPKESDSNAN